MNRFGTIEDQLRYKQGDTRELRVLDGIYGPNVIARADLGALMGGDRSVGALNDKWNTLTVAKEKK